MRKKSIWKKGALGLCMALVLGMCGCTLPTSAPTGETGQTALTESTEEVKTTEQSQESQSAETQKTEEKKDNSSKNMDALLGDWTLVAYETEDYYSFAMDYESADQLYFYKEDGAYKVDYYYEDYSTVEIIGMNPVEKAEALSEICENQDWSVTFSRKRGTQVDYAVTLLNENVLFMQQTSHSEYYVDENTTETYDYTVEKTYIRQDAQNFEELVDSFRYLETVTVSNIEELFQAIGNNKHIILKEGTYNISELELEKRDNPYLNYVYVDGESYTVEEDTIQISSLANLLIEGEAGKEVRITTEDPGTAPIALRYCDHVMLRNLTLGHDVEKGMCSGSVVHLESSNNITIENCNLFGSGTYGVEAYECYSLTVNDSDIYECTYGLVNFVSCSNFSFNRCKLRDSSEYAMFDMMDCWTIEFNDCEISNNYTNGNICNFIDTSNCYGLLFTRCDFKDNLFEGFSSGDADFSECTIDDTEASLW